MITSKKKNETTLEVLRKDKEALGRFLTEDPKVQEILVKCIRAGNLFGRVNKGEIISHLYVEVAEGPKNWLNHDIKDVYGYLTTVVKRFLFLNKYFQRSFMKEEYGIDNNIDEHSSSLDADPEDGRKLEERLLIDDNDEAGNDYKVLLEQFKAIVMIIWDKNPVNGELMYRKYIGTEDLRDIAEDFLNRGLISSVDTEHAYLSLVNRRLPATRDAFDAIALKMNYKLRFSKKSINHKSKA